MHQQQPFDLLDLKIRVPPHVTSKFHQHTQPVVMLPGQGPPPQQDFHGGASGNSGTTFSIGGTQAVFACVAAEDAAPQTKAQKQPLPMQSHAFRSYLRVLAALAVVLCLGPLWWIVSFHAENNRPEQLEERARQGARFFLLLGPFTLPTLVGFQACHARGRWFTFGLACCSLAMFNTVAVLYCCAGAGPLRMWLLSAAMITAVGQKLLLVHKGHVILLMVSTASAVVVCCLAIVAPLLPSLAMTYRCFESMVLPMLWLCWQASADATTMALTSSSSGSAAAVHSHAV
jgi:hypothetical protein